MKSKNIVCIFIALLTVFLLCLSSCTDKTEENESTTAYEYVPSDTQTTAGESESSAGTEQLNIDTSWTGNFNITYSILNPEVSPVPIKIREIKTDNVHSIEYLDGSSFYCWKQNGSDVYKYTVVANASEQVYKVYENESVTRHSVFFKECSEIDKGFPLLSNVCYEYDEVVAGRQCSKYIQRAYKDGKVTATLFVWADKEFGFAVKKEEYDENDKLVVMLELIDFSYGETVDEDVTFDESEYVFKEEQ